MTILSFLSICPFSLVLDKMDKKDSLDTKKQRPFGRIVFDTAPTTTQLRSNYGVFTW